MTPLKDLRIPHFVDLRLCMLTYIVASCTVVPTMRLFKPKLGLDGVEAAGVGILLQAAKIKKSKKPLISIFFCIFAFEMVICFWHPINN